MPLVWGERPDVDLWIVGKDPTRAVSELAQISGPGSGKIEIIGAVPEMGSYLGQATIAVAPLVYGAGIQNKVLEAMACGTPVVASPQAVSALAAREGEEVMVGRTPQEFAAAILTLLASPDKRARLGQAGRAFVQEHHAWSASAAHLERIYAAASN
jgi:glycosyltransferase involved in cell wall biosynthesis